MIFRQDIAIADMISQQLQQLTLDRHKIGPGNREAWGREVLTGPYSSLLNYLLLVESGEEMVIDFCCVPDSKPSSLETSKPIVTKTALVKLSGPQSKTKKDFPLRFQNFQSIILFPVDLRWLLRNDFRKQFKPVITYTTSPSHLPGLRKAGPRASSHHGHNACRLECPSSSFLPSLRAVESITSTDLSKSFRVIYYCLVVLDLKNNHNFPTVLNYGFT